MVCCLMLFIYGTVYNSKNRIIPSLDSIMKINVEKGFLSSIIILRMAPMKSYLEMQIITI